MKGDAPQTRYLGRVAPFHSKVELWAIDLWDIAVVEGFHESHDGVFFIVFKV
jgi:hypothetical protein